MIHRIFADNPSFKEIKFEQGVNVIIADQASNANQKDSRNGLGKSSIIEIVHFCLGSDLKKGGSLTKPVLSNWKFYCEITIGGCLVTISRAIHQPKFIFVEGKTTTWPLQPTYSKEHLKYVFTIDEWRSLLGKLMFNLPLTNPKIKFGPSFRQLINYFARLSKDGGYIRPFWYMGRQHAYQIQVLNAYLLNLSWEYAIDWRQLKIKEDELRSIKKASETGYFSDVVGSLGELETLALQLTQKINKGNDQLDSFRVHPQYRELEIDANKLSEDIHNIVNQNISQKRLISLYEKSLIEDKEASSDEVNQVYKEAGVIFPDKVIKRFEEVLEFHRQLTKNRKLFLKQEIDRLNRSVTENELKIDDLTEQRAQKLEILKTHKALEEYTKLQEILNKTKSQFENVKKRIELIKKFKADKSALIIEKEELLQNTRRDYEDRFKIRAKAITLFNECSESLYNKPGQLIIDVTENGYQFNIEIEREQSDGVRLMEIFCYDMVIAQLWSNTSTNPGFLLHDSAVFADVDERQISSAIKFATKVSQSCGFQYICCLNSDKIPRSLFEPDFNLKQFIRLELKDKPDNACLFGFRF